MENYITKRAIELAELEAKEIISAAKAAAKERISRARNEIERDSEAALAKAEKVAAEEARQAEIVAKTVAGRQSMAKRQGVVDQVFASVRKQVLGMNAKDTQDLVASLVKREARAGDVVTVSKSDEKKIPAEFFKKLSTKNLERKVSDGFEGGIRLENKSYELSLTVDDLLLELRGEMELAVSNILF